MKKLILLPVLIICLASFAFADGSEIFDDDNIISYWSFDVDESAANKVTDDRTGNLYNLTQENNPIWINNASCGLSGCYYTDGTIGMDFYNSAYIDSTQNNDGMYICLITTIVKYPPSGFATIYNQAYGAGQNKLSYDTTGTLTGSWSPNWDLIAGGTLPLYSKVLFCHSHNSTTDIWWKNNTLIGTDPSQTLNSADTNIWIHGYDSIGASPIGYIDEFLVGNRTGGLTQEMVDYMWNDGNFRGYITIDITPPSINIYNCTSCGQDTDPPFTTNDTTPTFWIETDEPAYCAIAAIDANYTTMIEDNAERNCSGGGTKYLTCTLQPDEMLINETDYAYIACKDTSDNENTTSTSGALEMEIGTPEVETIGDNAIMAGINSSTIWPATVYSNQQIYLRDIDNNQVTGTFDKVASKENQWWAFNYITSTESFIIGLFNLTPAVYAVEYEKLTYQQLNDSVREVIDTTYNP